MNTLEDLIFSYKNTQESHRLIHETLVRKTNEEPKLKELRDWVETNIWGFGERSFYWMFKLLCDRLPENMTFLEIGVFRGQTLALIKTIKPKAKIVGITPLDSTGDHWESDYEADIKKLHKTFNLCNPNIIKGLSTDETIIGKAIEFARYYYDVVYIDGGHAYDVIKWDLSKYPYMVKIGGYLVVDDCCNNLDIPMGMFAGIETVTQAVSEWEETQTDFKLLFSVVHIKVYQRVA